MSAVPVRADSPVKPVTDFVRDHPVLVLAGGLAAGVLAAAFIPRRNRTRIARGASHLAEVAAAAGLALGRQAWEKAESASSEVRRHGGSLAGKVEDLGGSARASAGKSYARAEKAASGTARRIADLAADIHARIKH